MTWVAQFMFSQKRRNLLSVIFFYCYNSIPFQTGGYDSSNAFVLPVGKRTLIKAKPATTTRILSKKQRKKLEKVVDKKKKKTERGELIEKLMSVQVTVHPLSSHI